MTLVLKADLGGYLSEGSKVGRALGPLMGVALRGVLEPVVTSIVTIRDQVYLYLLLSCTMMHSLVIHKGIFIPLLKNIAMFIHSTLLGLIFFIFIGGTKPVCGASAVHDLWRSTRTR